jgi:hypothetical protein
MTPIAEPLIEKSEIVWGFQVFYRSLRLWQVRNQRDALHLNVTW